MIDQRTKWRRKKFIFCSYFANHQRAASKCLCRRDEPTQCKAQLDHPPAPLIHSNSSRMISHCRIAGYKIYCLGGFSPASFPLSFSDSFSNILLFRARFCCPKYLACQQVFGPEFNQSYQMVWSLPLRYICWSGLGLSAMLSLQFHSIRVIHFF